MSAARTRRVCRVDLRKWITEAGHAVRGRPIHQRPVRKLLFVKRRQLRQVGARQAGLRKIGCADAFSAQFRDSGGQGSGKTGRVGYRGEVGQPAGAPQSVHHPRGDSFHPELAGRRETAFRDGWGS